MSRIPVSNKNRHRAERRKRIRSDYNIEARRPIYDNVEEMKASKPLTGSIVSTSRYYEDGEAVPNMNYVIQSAVDFGGTPDELVNFTLASGDVAVNIEDTLTGSMGGMRSDGADYTANLQALAANLNPDRSLFIDSTDFSLSGFTSFNTGFKKVSHASGCVVTFLGAGELSSTARALYGVNIDAAGLRTNETILSTTATVTSRGDEIFTLVDASSFSVGDCLRVDKHICVITEISGNVVTTDRTYPVRTLAAGAEASRLDIPNTGSVLEGPSLIKFAPDRATRNYGFGALVTLCVGIQVSGFRSLYNASRLAELFYCADSHLTDVYQKSPTANPIGGQSYAARISNGNDNTVSDVKSYNGRHCVDITFSHRNVVRDCSDFNGNDASYLTHFNGCRDNEFIRCHLYDCDFGVYLGGQSAGDGTPEDLVDGDQNNIIRDSKFINSRGLYRMTQKNRAINCQFLNDTAASFRDVIVPRGNGESVFNMEDCEVDIVNDFCNVDEDFTVNMTGGSYYNNRIDGLFRGSAGSEGTANIVFNFRDVYLRFTIGQGRYNINAKLNFLGCNIDYEEQPFGEKCGDQNYHHCKITCTNASDRFLLTVGDGNSCELFGNIIKGTDLYFRYFSGFAATGTVTFGDNTLEKAVAVNILNNMNWATKGYATMPLGRSNNGSPVDGTVVYIDSDVTTDPFKRKRVGGAWVDWTI